MIVFCVPCCSCATHLTPTATSHRRRLYLVVPFETLSFVNRLEKFSNPHIRPLWRQAWAAREDALGAMSRTTESLRAHSRPLRPLVLGETVFLQNQQGPSPHKWDRSGVVVESLGHDQYRVRVAGSGRLTLRNRRFLRSYTPATPYARQQPAALLTPPATLDRQPLPFHPGLVMPRGVVPQAADGPRDAALDTSPPEPPGEASSGLGARDVPVPTGVDPDASLPASQSPHLGQPFRTKMPPRR